MATKTLVLEGLLTKRSIKSKSTWKPRYFKLFEVEGGPPLLQYFRKMEDSKPKGQLVLGPGTTATLKRDLTKKSFFGMLVKINEVDAKHVKGEKSKKVKHKMKDGETAMYCYADSFGDISKWVNSITLHVGRASRGDTGTNFRDSPLPGDVEAKDTSRDDSVLKMGILYKKSKKKKWKPKFFVLEGATLMYYDSELDYEVNPYRPSRRISLIIGSDKCEVGPMPEKKKRPENTFGFSLTKMPKTKGGKMKSKYNLCADTKAECEEWIQIISTALTSDGEYHTQIDEHEEFNNHSQLSLATLDTFIDFGDDNRHGIITISNKEAEGVFLDKKAPNDPSRAAELNAEINRRNTMILRRAAATGNKDLKPDEESVHKQAVKALMLRDFEEMKSESEAKIASQQKDVQGFMAKLKLEDDLGNYDQKERYRMRIQQKRLSITREESRLTVIKERCSEAVSELREAENDKGNSFGSAHPRRVQQKTSDIGIPPVYKFTVSFVDNTKLGLKLSKRIKAGGSAVIIVLGFNRDENGERFQQHATSQIQVGDVLYAVEDKTSIEEQLKGIKSRKRPLRVTFQRNVQVLTATDDANRKVLDSHVFENKDKRVLDAIAHWEEFPKAMPDYWYNPHREVAPESAWQPFDLKSLSVGQVCQLLNSWNLFKAFGKEFLQYEINGQDLLRLEEIQFERNKDGFPNATPADTKLLFKKLHQVGGGKVMLFNPHSAWQPEADPDKMRNLYEYFERGGAGPNDPTPDSCSI